MARPHLFGGLPGAHPDGEDAAPHVRSEGLAALAERWTLVDLASGDEQAVCIQDASPTGVTVALDCSSLPGVPTRRLDGDDLAGDRWRLDRHEFARRASLVR